MASAKDIGKQTKVFKNLVMQLAVERERLNKQVKIRLLKYYFRP